MRVLIAEDDLTSRNILAAVLRKSGFEAVETTNGAEAWAVMQEEHAPRLAIIDWMMPEMDGISVVRRIRAMKTKLSPYVILLTAKGEKSDIIAGLEAGADDYLTKPFDAGELKARVNVGIRLIEAQDALVKAQEVLEFQATHDPLTGIFNRQAILEYLHKELARAERFNDSLAVGMCDIDYFKLINDRYGHQTGDDVLCAIAKIFTGYIRKYDAVGRIGGEEFLLVTSIRGGIECASIYDRLCTLISNSVIETRSGPLSITVSIGVCCGVAGVSPDNILAIADKALYQAKEQGRNRVVCSPMGDH